MFHPSQHKVNSYPGILDGVVFRHLYVPSQDRPRQCFQARSKRVAEKVWECDARVDHSRMHHLESAQIVFHPVADQYRLGKYKTQKILLNVTQPFRNIFEVVGRDTAEPRIVIDYFRVGLHQSIVHDSSVHIDHGDFNQLEAASSEAHLAIKTVHTVITILRHHLRQFRAHVIVEWAVVSRGRPRPHVINRGGTAPGHDRAAATLPQLDLSTVQAVPQLAPVVNAGFLVEVFAIFSIHVEILMTPRALPLDRHQLRRRVVFNVRAPPGYPLVIVVDGIRLDGGGRVFSDVRTVGRGDLLLEVRVVHRTSARVAAVGLAFGHGPLLVGARHEFLGVRVQVVVPQYAVVYRVRVVDEHHVSRIKGALDGIAELSEGLPGERVAAQYR